ncbi:MAG: sigma-54 dependent transcriptional regulator, partial [Pseudomonadota bacterium]
VTINAAAITPSRMEIELFGTEPNGAERKVGALEQAHGGILYLDEVADMPLETQSKILRVLVEQEFERVGGVRRVKVDVRIISSTAFDLEALIEDGRFRRDLYSRLAVVPIEVPPLTARREDIGVLVQTFMKQIAEQTGIKAKIIDDDAMAVLQSHTWPGNIRQLRNAIERLMILTRDESDEILISVDKLPAEVSENLPKAPTEADTHIMSLPLREARERFERDYLLAQISRFGGNISRTAEFIGMERSALHRKLKSLGV